MISGGVPASIAWRNWSYHAVPFAARAPQFGFSPACSHASHVTGGFLELVLLCEVQVLPTVPGGIEEVLFLFAGEALMHGGCV